MSVNDQQQLFDEIQFLNQFDLQSMHQGIKVHSSASSSMQQACQRLHQKGLIDQADGGYLTHRGVVAAQHAKTLLQTLSFNTIAA